MDFAKKNVFVGHGDVHMIGLNISFIKDDLYFDTTLLSGTVGYSMLEQFFHDDHNNF